MTQDERWLNRYKDVMDFMEKNHRNPSRHRLEEHDLLNWIKSNRKLKNNGELKAERAEMLERLLSLWGENHEIIPLMKGKRMYRMQSLNYCVYCQTKHDI